MCSLGNEYWWIQTKPVWVNNGNLSCHILYVIIISMCHYCALIVLVLVCLFVNSLVILFLSFSSLSRVILVCPYMCLGLLWFPLHRTLSFIPLIIFVVSYYHGWFRLLFFSNCFLLLFVTSLLNNADILDCPSVIIFDFPEPFLDFWAFIPYSWYWSHIVTDCFSSVV